MIRQAEYTEEGLLDRGGSRFQLNHWNSSGLSRKDFSVMSTYRVLCQNKRHVWWYM